MTRHLVATGFIVLACGAQPALAQQQKQGWKRQPTPYRGLFQTEDLKARAQNQHDALASQRPRVVCGMTLIPMDPDIDPKMIVPRPPNDTRYTIRAIPPPICR